MNPVGAKIDLARFAFATEFLKSESNEFVSLWFKRFRMALMTGTEVEWLKSLGVYFLPRGR